MIQVDKRESGWDSTMERLADLLESEGIEIESCYETPWVDGEWWTMELVGDDSTGKKAVKLATDIGCRPKVLQGQWNLDKESDAVEWTLLFREEIEVDEYEQTEVEVKTQDRSMAALAEILRAEGVEIVWHCEPEGNRLDSDAVMVFRGGDDAGMQALRVAWAHGYYPYGMQKDWTLCLEEIAEPDWVLLFD